MKKEKYVKAVCEGGMQLFRVEGLLFFKKDEKLATI